ncbi:MAG: hypothetical protein KAR40_15655 [Candidatus Sabulitectum sp.]|nr:hypothetical protein [Candidatus Sabulitectum sp.]
MIVDLSASRHGLPDSLIVPVAARDIASVEKYVGKIDERIVGRSGRLNAFTVIPHFWPVKKEKNVSLWSHQNSSEYYARLHPSKQCWVHVDYTGYRRAYKRMGMPEIPEKFVLDHIRNREAIRLRNYSHPYLRLCPVSKKVNCSGGVNAGQEGMEKDHLRSLDSLSESVRAAVLKAIDCNIVYADPSDMTKMLNIPPGTKVLAGVADMLKHFYPR